MVVAAVALAAEPDAPLRSFETVGLFVFRHLGKVLVCLAGLASIGSHGPILPDLERAGGGDLGGAQATEVGAARQARGSDYGLVAEEFGAKFSLEDFACGIAG